MQIGTIVKSNSHISYLCRVYGKLETEATPEPDQYAFGTFVAIRPVENSPVRLIGVVRDTLLLNPDFGNVGPRLSSPRDLAVLSPDYVNETGVLVDVLILGWQRAGETSHTVPAVAAQIGSPVDVLRDGEVVEFHRDPRGGFLMGYFPQMVTRNDPMVASLLLAILERLEPEFPKQQRVLAVLKSNLAWKSRVIPAG